MTHVTVALTYVSMNVCRFWYLYADKLLVCTACAYKRVIAKRNASDSTFSTYTMCQIRRHCHREDCWLVAHQKVYDASGFLDDHPAGPRPILSRAGQDCTVDYDFHSTQSHTKYWKPRCIGKVLPCPVRDSSANSPCTIM